VDEHDFILGVDLDCSAAHVATLADAVGRLVWSNHRFHTSTGRAGAVVVEGASGGSAAAGDRADSERLGAVGGVVSGPRSA
jgi:hypothetical protein